MVYIGYHKALILLKDSPIIPEGYEFSSHADGYTAWIMVNPFWKSDLEKKGPGKENIEKEKTRMISSFDADAYKISKFLPILENLADENKISDSVEYYKFEDEKGISFRFRDATSKQDVLVPDLLTLMHQCDRQKLEIRKGVFLTKGFNQYDLVSDNIESLFAAATDIYKSADMFRKD